MLEPTRNSPVGAKLNCSLDGRRMKIPHCGSAEPRSEIAAPAPPLMNNQQNSRVMNKDECTENPVQYAKKPMSVGSIKKSRVRLDREPLHPHGTGLRTSRVKGFQRNPFDVTVKEKTVDRPAMAVVVRNSRPLRPRQLRRAKQIVQLHRIGRQRPVPLGQICHTTGIDGTARQAGEGPPLVRGLTLRHRFEPLHPRFVGERVRLEKGVDHIVERLLLVRKIGTLKRGLFLQDLKERGFVSTRRLERPHGVHAASVQRGYQRAGKMHRPCRRLGFGERNHIFIGLCVEEHRLPAQTKVRFALDGPARPPRPRQRR